MRRFVAVLVAALPIIAACGERQVPVAPAESESLINDPVAQVARSIALALGDAAQRKSLAEALHASPYVEQKLEFARFRTTSTGDAMLRAAASVTALNELPALELYLPIADQRAEWNGSPDVWVLGTSLNDSKVKRLGLTHLPAFDVRGEVHWVSMRGVPSATLISLVPVESHFDEGAPAATAVTRSAADAAITGGWVMDQIQMSQQPWVYDASPFGRPEFEVWLAKYIGNNNWTVPLDAANRRPCGSEEYATWELEYFNYDNPPSLYTRDFRFAQGTRAQLNAIYGSGGFGGGFLVISENDDTACPHSAEPSTDEFDNTDWGNDDELLGLFGLPDAGDVHEFTNQQANNDPVHWRIVFSPNPPPPPPPPPPPLTVTIDGPGFITVKGTYTYTAQTSGFTNPTFTWQSRICDDGQGTTCTAWDTITGLGSTYNRTLSPDCSTPEKNFQLHVMVQNNDGRVMEADHTTWLCGAA